MYNVSPNDKTKEQCNCNVTFMCNLNVTKNNLTLTPLKMCCFNKSIENAVVKNKRNVTMRKIKRDYKVFYKRNKDVHEKILT